MIVLDASVVIAQLHVDDLHHARAVELFRVAYGVDLYLHSMTLAEALVGPSRAGTDEIVRGAISRLGIAEWVQPAGLAGALAQLRVETGLKVPDCCVLLAARETGSALATFDDALAQAAATMGVEAIPPR